MRYKFFVFFLFFCAVLEAKIPVLVSIAPQKYLVEQIGGEEVTVNIIVPAGANSHTYEPTPKQVIAAQRGRVWFRIGESFEKKIIPSLKQIEIVDQREGLELIHAGAGCCLSDSYDPHIWLSPRCLQKQATQIASILSRSAPEHQALFAANLAKLEAILEALDRECASLLQDSYGKSILVSHPAFGYLCRDYGLEQLSIEMEGREPTPRFISDLLAKVRPFQIKIVFLQTQHNPKGGIKIAQTIGASTCYIDPYVENVVENIRIIAALFNQA